MTARPRPARMPRALAISLVRFAIGLAVYGTAALAYRYGLGRTGRPPLAAVVAVTALVAVLLWLARARIDQLADRLAFGSAGRGYQAVRGLLARMATSLPVDEVVPRLAEAAGRTAHSPRAEVRLWLDDGQRWSQVWPAPAPPSPAQLTVSVQHRGEQVGEIEVDASGDSVSPFDRRLLDQLAAPAGLALSTVRLTYALRARSDELERVTAALHASRARLLDAQRVEQRRLQAEVDDQVMPHLDAAARAVAAGAAAADRYEPPRLDAAGIAAGRALDALRLIARGVFPPRLADAGLADSVQSWQQRRGVAVRVAATGDQGLLHSRPDLEASLYFSVVTALGALADKAARDLAVDLRVTADAADVRISGRGAAAVNPDAVVAVRDRIEAFDGTLQFDDDGTSVSFVARVPIADAVVVAP